ncbi:MAG: outer membrane lipoprotein carrier protein LolA [Spirochaetota bacterium]
MNKKTIIILIIFLCFNASVAYTDDWEEIGKVAKAIKTVSAKFTQEKHMKILVKPLVSEGRFFFSAPKSLRWEYVTPVKSILLSHNGRVKSYIEGRNGLTEDTRAKAQAMEIVMQEITSWLAGRFHDDPNFKATLSKGAVDRIILTPRDKTFAGIISSIELAVSRTEGVVKSVKISESGDSYTLIKFSAIEHNKNIDERLYRNPE